MIFNNYLEIYLYGPLLDGYMISYYGKKTVLFV